MKSVLILALGSIACFASSGYGQWLTCAGHNQATCSASNVGISPGTTAGSFTPTHPLDVDGTSRFRNNVFLGSTSNPLVKLYFWPDTSGSWIGTVDGAGIDFYGKGGLLRFWNADSVMTGYGPTAALTVNASATGANIAVFKNAANVSMLNITSAGNVGVGTIDPKARIHVFSGATSDAAGGMGPCPQYETNPALQCPAFNFGYSGASFGRGSGFLNVRPDPLATGDNPSLRFATADVVRMMIDKNGQVSINGVPSGTQSSDKFVVNGASRNNGTAVFTSSAAPSTSGTIDGGQISLAGYPTKVTFGNGQFIQDNGSANMRIFAGAGLSVDTSAGNITLSPATGFVGISAVPTVPLDVYNAGNALIRARGGYSGLLLTSGNGTTSTRYSFIDMTSSETQGNTWRLGMNGTQDFTLTDFAPPYPVRMTMTRAGEFTVNGNISATGTINAKYQDVAEWVPASVEMRPGTVVVLNPEKGSEVMPSAAAYDMMVAGVVSAQPGLLLGEASPSKARIATTGRVKVHVDASAHSIAVGDLLVTSDKPGTAMRSQPIDINGRKFHQPGTVIGKALEPLASGEGEILVLLSMQ